MWDVYKDSYAVKEHVQKYYFTLMSTSLISSSCFMCVLYINSIF